MTTNGIRMALVVLLVLPLCGCGARQAARRIQTQNDLRLIGLAFFQFDDANSGKAPSKAEDLKKFLGDSPEAAKKLDSGELVFIYGANVKSMGTGAANTILGYEKDVPTKGGAVLMGDCTVKQMTVQEFGAAAKAKGQ
jgi:hypothetical protein